MTTPRSSCDAITSAEDDEMVMVYFVQRSHSFPVAVNAATRPVLAGTHLVQLTGQYFIDQRDSQQDYATLEANIIMPGQVS